MAALCEGFAWRLPAQEFGYEDVTNSTAMIRPGMTTHPGMHRVLLTLRHRHLVVRRAGRRRPADTTSELLLQCRDVRMLRVRVPSVAEAANRLLRDHTMVLKLDKGALALRFDAAEELQLWEMAVRDAVFVRGLPDPAVLTALLVRQAHRLPPTVAHRMVTAGASPLYQDPACSHSTALIGAPCPQPRARARGSRGGRRGVQARQRGAGCVPQPVRGRP